MKEFKTFSLNDYASEYLNNLSKRRKPINIGWNFIDKDMGGIEENSLYLIGSPSGDGKTNFMRNIFFKLTNDLREKAVFYHTETNAHNFDRKFFSIYADSNISLKDSVKNHGSVLCQLRFNIEDLKEDIAQYVKQGYRFFFIDNIENIFPSDQIRVHNRESADSVADEIARLVRKHKITIFLSAQLQNMSGTRKLSSFNEENFCYSPQPYWSSDYAMVFKRYPVRNKGKEFFQGLIVKNQNGWHDKEFYFSFPHSGIKIEECLKPDFAKSIEMKKN